MATETVKFVLEFDDRGTPSIRRLTGSLEQLEKTANKAQGGFGNFSRGVITANQAAQLASATIRTLQTAIEGSFSAVIAKGDQLQGLSRRFQVPADTLGKLKFAAEQANLSIDELAPSLRRFQIALVNAGDKGSQAAKAFADLGISGKQIEALKGDPLKAILSMADAFNKYKDNAGKVSDANALFGRGTAVLQFFKEGTAEMKKNFETAQKLGIVWKDLKVDAVDNLGDALGTLRGAFEGLRDKIFANDTVVAKLTSAFESATDSVVHFTESISDESISKFADDLVTIIGLMASLSSGIMSVVGALQTMGEKGGEAFGNLIQWWSARNGTQLSDKTLSKQAQVAQMKASQGLGGFSGNAGFSGDPNAPGIVPTSPLGEGGPGDLRPSLKGAPTGGGAGSAAKHAEELRKKLAELKQEVADLDSGLSPLEQDILKTARGFEQFSGEAEKLLRAQKLGEIFAKIHEETDKAKNSFEALADPTKAATLAVDQYIKELGLTGEMAEQVRPAVQELFDTQNAEKALEIQKKYTDQMEELVDPASAAAHELRDAREEAVRIGRTDLLPLIDQFYQLKGLTEQFNKVWDAVSGGFDTLLQGFILGTRDMKSALEGLKATALKIVSDIAMSVVKQGLFNIFAGLFGASVPTSGNAGGTGFFGSLLGGAGSGTGVSGGSAGGSGLLMSLGKTVVGGILGGGTTGSGTGGILSNLLGGGGGGSVGGFNTFGVGNFVNKIPGFDKISGMLGFGGAAGGATGLFGGGAAGGIGTVGASGIDLATGAGYSPLTSLGGNVVSGTESAATVGGGGVGTAASSIAAWGGLLVALGLGAKGIADTRSGYKAASLGQQSNALTATQGSLIGGFTGIGAGIGSVVPVIGTAVGAAVGAAVGTAVSNAIGSAVNKGIISGRQSSDIRQGQSQAGFTKAIQSSLGDSMMLSILAGGSNNNSTIAGGFAKLFAPSIEMIYQKLFQNVINQGGLGISSGSGITNKNQRAYVSSIAGQNGDANTFAQIIASMIGSGVDNQSRLGKFTQQILGGVAQTGGGSAQEVLYKALRGVFGGGQSFTNALDTVRVFQTLARTSAAGIDPATASAGQVAFRNRDQERSDRVQDLVVRSYQSLFPGLDLKTFASVMTDTKSGNAFFNNKSRGESQNAVYDALKDFFKSGDINGFGKALTDTVANSFNDGIAKAIAKSPIGDIASGIFQLSRKAKRKLKNKGFTDDVVDELEGNIDDAVSGFQKLFNSGKDFLIGLQRVFDLGFKLSVALKLAIGDIQGAIDVIKARLKPFQDIFEGFKNLQSSNAASVADIIAGSGIGGANVKVDFERRKADETLATISPTILDMSTKDLKGALDKLQQYSQERLTALADEASLARQARDYWRGVKEAFTDMVNTLDVKRRGPRAVLDSVTRLQSEIKANLGTALGPEGEDQQRALATIQKDLAALEQASGQLFAPGSRQGAAIDDFVEGISKQIIGRAKDAEQLADDRLKKVIEELKDFQKFMDPLISFYKDKAFTDLQAEFDKIVKALGPLAGLDPVLQELAKQLGIKIPTGTTDNPATGAGGNTTIDSDGNVTINDPCAEKCKNNPNSAKCKRCRKNHPNVNATGSAPVPDMAPGGVGRGVSVDGVNVPSVVQEKLDSIRELQNALHMNVTVNVTGGDPKLVGTAVADALRKQLVPELRRELQKAASGR